MSEQETYSPPTADTAGAPPATLPNDEYHRPQQATPERSGRNLGLGIALVVVGFLLLAFQFVGGIFGGGGSYPLVDTEQAGSKIEISVGNSDVKVSPWNGDQIKIEATQHGGSRGDYTVNVNKSGDTVRISESGGNFFCLFCSSNISYRISMPQNAQADISTTSGDIRIDGLSGAVVLGTVSGEIQAGELTGGLQVRSTSGEVQLRSIGGALKVETISGDVRLDGGNVSGADVSTTSGEIRLDGAGGDVAASTVSGDIRLQNARDAQLNISTTSGNVEYAGSLRRDGTNEVNTISGNVQLDLPQDSSFQLAASTVSGGISNEFGLGANDDGERNLAGVVGGGGATLTIATTSGDIVVDER